MTKKSFSQKDRSLQRGGTRRFDEPGKEPFLLVGRRLRLHEGPRAFPFFFRCAPVVEDRQRLDHLIRLAGPQGHDGVRPLRLEEGLGTLGLLAWSDEPCVERFVLGNERLEKRRFIPFVLFQNVVDLWDLRRVVVLEVARQTGLVVTRG